MNIIEKKSIKGHKKKPRKTMIFPVSFTDRQILDELSKHRNVDTAWRKCETTVCEAAIRGILKRCFQKPRLTGEYLLSVPAAAKRYDNKYECKRHAPREMRNLTEWTLQSAPYFKSEGTMRVYFAQTGYGFCKIGMSENPTKRVKRYLEPFKANEEKQKPHTCVFADFYDPRNIERLLIAHTMPVRIQELSGHLSNPKRTSFSGMMETRFVAPWMIEAAVQSASNILNRNMAIIDEIEPDFDFEPFHHDLAQLQVFKGQILEALKRH